MSSAADPQVPVELSWATFQRKVLRGGGVAHYIPLQSLRLDLSISQSVPDPVRVYICDVVITAWFRRVSGVTGEIDVDVAVRTTNFPISEPSPLGLRVALSSSDECVRHSIEVSHAKVFVPSSTGSHAFVSEVEFVAAQAVLGRAALKVQATVRR